MKAILRAGAAALAAALVPCAASADPFWVYERNAAVTQSIGQIYFGPAFSGGIQHLPRFNSTFHFFRPNGGTLLSVSSFDPELKVVQPGGTIGFLMRDGTLPPWLGTRARVFLSGSYTTGWVTHTKSNSFIGTDGAAAAGVGGIVTVSGPLGVPATLAETLKVQRDAFDLRLGFATDIALNPDLTFSPRVAVFGGWSSDKYSYFGDLFTATNTRRHVAVDERLRSTEFGGEVGASIAWMFHPGFTLNAGASAGVVYVRSRLQGTDCTAIVVAAAAVPCGPGQATFVSTSVSARDSTVGFRGGASLGLSVDMRGAILSIGGTFRYDSRIPGIANPQLTSQQAAGSANATARVRFEDGFAYGGFLRLTVPLPGLGL